MACWCAVAVVRGAPADLSQLHVQLAKAEESEDNAAVAELGRRIVALAPNESAIWEKVARAQFAVEDYDRCEQTLEAWSRATKSAPAAIEDIRGDVAAKREDYAAAEKHWLAFIAKKPSRDDVATDYDNLGDVCVEQSRWKDNVDYRSKAIATQDSAERRVNRATAYLRLHQWDAAYADINKANTIDSADEQVKEWLPQFERLEDFLPVIKAIEARIAKAPGDVDLLLQRARLFTVAVRPLLALDDCERVMKLQPQSMRVRIQTAEAFIDTKQPEEAEKLQISASLTREADGHVSEQRLRELTDEDARISRNAHDPGAFAARAGTLRYLNQYTLALADARAALAIDDKMAAAHAEVGLNLDRLDQEKEALVHLIKATELDPNDAETWYRRGVLEADRTKFVDAIDSLTRSLKLNESVSVLREREKIERRIGQVEKANADQKRIDQLDPPRK